MCLAEEDSWRLCGCILDLFVLPFVCVFGLLLNTLCLVVFARARTHTSHPLVPALIVLSACDLLQLFFPFLFFLSPLFTTLLMLILRAFSVKSLTWPQVYCLRFCWRVTVPQFGPSVISQSSDTRPSYLHYNTCVNLLVHSPPLLLITVVALIFNALKWAEYSWRWIEIDDDEWILMHEPSDLALDSVYRKIFDHILYPLCVYLVPLVLLTVLNLRILSHISLHRPTLDQKSRLAQERRSVTLLISIVILFFVCHTGGLAIRFMDREEYENRDWFVLLKDVINLLFNFNSFANPMLYFFFTRQFRDLRTNLLHGHFSPAARSSVGGQHSLLNSTSFIDFASERTP